MRVLIFFATTSRLQQAQAFFPAAFSIEGRQSLKEKSQNIKGFNESDGIMLASLQGGATGWFANPDTIILFDADCLNAPAKLLLQAKSRNHHAPAQQ